MKIHGNRNNLNCLPQEYAAGYASGQLTILDKTRPQRTLFIHG
jgi:hypothetical protein